jgi:hypothetical protein
VDEDDRGPPGDLLYVTHHTLLSRGNRWAAD